MISIFLISWFLIGLISILICFRHDYNNGYRFSKKLIFAGLMIGILGGYLSGLSLLLVIVLDS